MDSVGAVWPVYCFSSHMDKINQQEKHEGSLIFYSEMDIYIIEALTP